MMLIESRTRPFVVCEKRIVTFVFALVICFAFETTAHGQGSVCIFIPNVPDKNQPPASGRNNWCTPTAAVNIIEYWDNIKCNAGAYRVMDGWSTGIASDSIGWFMDTNDQGSPNRFNSTPGSGTYNQDIQPGLVEFVRWDQANLFGHVMPNANKVGYDWSIQTDYSIGFDFHAAEVDSGRPTLITFLYWNLIPTGVIETDQASGESIEVYDWGAQVSSPEDPTDPEETWNLIDGEDGIGHAVTGVGYWRNFSPGGTLTTGDWVIVHDNWPRTPVHVAVPWQNWTSVTKVKVLPFIIDAPFSAAAPTVNGTISAGEYSNGDSLQFIQNGDITKVYYKVDGSNFYLAFDLSNTSATSSARVYFDTLHDEAITPQSDDYRFTHTIGNHSFENQGTGTGWSSDRTPNGWASAINVGSGGWQAEFRFSYSKLGLIAGVSDTLGISLWDAGTSNGDHRWPTGADDLVPCSWGDIFSSDLFVPVELVSFDAEVIDNNHVLLIWNTETESANFGFEVQRRTDNTTFENIGFVKGGGTSSEPQNYTFLDQNLAPGIYFYRLKQVDFDGAFEYSPIISAEVPVPNRFTLHQNYPNPFNASTKLTFELPEVSHVVIEIFNTAGQEVKTLGNRRYSAGIHEVIWDGLERTKSGAASGLYLYRIKAKNFVEAKKMLLIR